MGKITQGKVCQVVLIGAHHSFKKYIDLTLDVEAQNLEINQPVGN